MKIFKPLETIANFKNLVFLAGPCPRAGQDWTDWRDGMIDELKRVDASVDVAIPTNPNFDTGDPTYYERQCSWETRALHFASCIVFWVDRNEEHPALTTNIEFGIWSEKSPQSIVVGVPQESQHCGYIKWVCKQKGIPCFDSMEGVASEVASRFRREKKIFFTSDTHFFSGRHLELSKRPFRNVSDMDLNMVSNWNKKVTANDTVVHLGDFGDPEMVRFLNFGNMEFLYGNYERNYMNSPFIFVDPRVNICTANSMSLMVDDVVWRCVHEPLSNINISDFYLFGHIHEKSKVKRNGYNVGIDANNYQLVDLDTIKFYKNAILNHYDDNVFCESCK